MKKQKPITIWLAAGLILASLATFTFCKKDTPMRNLQNAGNMPAGVSAKLYGTYSGVSYNSTLDMLEFDDWDAYNKTKTSLASELQANSFDKGHTQQLLDLFSTDPDMQTLVDSLVHNSPLSDTIMLKFLKAPGIPFDEMKRVVAACNVLTPRQLDAVASLGLGQAEMLQLEDILVHRSPYMPGLSDFEAKFSSYTSYRKRSTQEEIDYLALGNDPEADGSPVNNRPLDAIEGTLHNDKLEIKIGNKITKLLPHRSIYIIENDNTKDMLDYVRANEGVPFNTIPQNEPTNGFNISVAPAPVSADIVVEAIDYNPIGQERLLIYNTPGTNAHTFNFSCNVAGSAYKYYWNFGDGKVSYKANPAHTFDPTQDIHVTLMVYDSYGVSVFGEVGNPNPQPMGSPPCTVMHSMLASQSAPLLATASIYISDVNFSTTNGLDCHYEWGDNTGWNTSHFVNVGWHTLQHTYAAPGSYVIQSYCYSMSAIGSSCLTGMKTSKLNVTNGPVENCCVKRDRHKEVWRSSGLSYKFKHIAKLRNNLITKGSVDSECHTFHKVKIWFIHFWFPINATACVTVNGNWYVPCTNSPTALACDGTASSFSSPTPGCSNSWYVHNVNHQPGVACHVYLKKNGALSTAVAFGQTSNLYLSDDCFDWDWWGNTFPNWPF